MNTFRRYFIKEFFKFFFIFLVGFTAISVIAEFFDKVTEFYSKKPPLLLIVQYLALQTPRVILYALPFASLFSVLITIGMAAKWREIVVIRASGGSTKKLFSVFLMLGIVVTLIALLLGETVVPDATRMSSYIRKVKILKESPTIVEQEEAIWMRGLSGELVRISGFDENGNRLLKTSIFSFSGSFGIDSRIEAEEAEWKEGMWILKNVTVFDFARSTVERLPSLPTQSIEEPSIFREEIKKPKEMNFRELYAYYSRLQKAGVSNLKYTVRLYEKLAYPSINFIMILFGVALALHTVSGGGIRSAGLGVIVSVLYWLLYSVSISLGNTGILKPWFAPWVSPLVFALAGSYLYSRIRE